MVTNVLSWENVTHISRSGKQTTTFVKSGLTQIVQKGLIPGPVLQPAQPDHS